MKFNIENRRYIGSKFKLMPKISDLILSHTEGRSFFDVFAGTGVVSSYMLPHYDRIILNDLLYSNNVIYDAFFNGYKSNRFLLQNFMAEILDIHKGSILDNYFSKNFGNTYFSQNDARIIGEIRERIENNNLLSALDKNVLLASLIYSTDKIANTVGHYEAYRKRENIKDRFLFELVKPINTINKTIEIYRSDANDLVKRITADIAFIDPPYNSRQYSRFYHVLDTLSQWDKPELYGIAKKPKEQNMSEYCRVKAPDTFDDLIQNIDVRYIVTTYNNTYASKSKSSQNKITHEQILCSLGKVGNTKQFEFPHIYFNAGKTSLQNHAEFVFITEVTKKCKS